MNIYKLVFLIITLPILISVTSCATNRNTNNPYDMTLSEEVLGKFSNKGNVIFYDSEEVAVTKSTEWEYNPNNGNIIMEISITQTNPYDSDMTSNIIKYVHYLYPDAKIEVNFF